MKNIREQTQNHVISLLISFFWIAYITTRPTFTAPVFFGDKTVAMFDLWSFQHLCSGVILGAILRNRTTRPFFIVLIVVYGWEALEWAMESGLAGQTVAHWKAGHEHWSNRLFSDPLMAIIGAKLSFRFRRLVWVAIPMTIIWCLTNIVASNCMTIQQYIFAFFTT